jgi:hypothetical protein
MKNYTFEDKGLNSGQYAYRLKIVENTGVVRYSEEIETHIDTPIGYELFQNYPNPFNPTTTISFTIPKVSYVKLEIVSITGEIIESIASGLFEPGYYNVFFNGANLSSGFYICRLVSDNYTRSIKLTIMK